MDVVRAYYVIVAAIMVVIVWTMFKAAPIRQQNDFDEVIPQKTRRDELLEAQERITRQIDILRGRRSPAAFNGENIKRLRTILREIEAELTASGPR